MPIASGRRITTREAFEKLPQDDGRDYQVLGGELFVTPAPGIRHQLVTARLLSPLVAYVEEHGLGMVTPGINLELGPSSYLIPDVAFIPAAEAGRLLAANEVWVDRPPALVVEIVSPSSSGYDRVKKRRAYHDWGVPEYWVVDADARWVEIYRLRDGATEPEVVTGDLLWTPDPRAPTLRLALDSFLGMPPGMEGAEED